MKIFKSICACFLIGLASCNRTKIPAAPTLVGNGIAILFPVRDANGNDCFNKNLNDYFQVNKNQKFISATELIGDDGGPTEYLVIAEPIDPIPSVSYL